MIKIGTDQRPWEFVENESSDTFLMRMLEYGYPVEVSFVGAFDHSGRGSRRDVPLPFHKDGDYSKSVASKHSIDIVGLYCLREGDAITVFKHKGEEYPVVLKQGQGIIFDNQKVLHARRGSVGDRILLRVWIESKDKEK